MDATITFYLGLTAGLRSGKAKVMQHMKQRGVSREQREVVWQQVLELKTKLHAEAQKTRYARAAWGDVIKPLVWERQRVRVMLGYKAKVGEPARRAALERYQNELAGLLHGWFMPWSAAGKTPKEKIAERKQKGKEPILNDGEHWTDWFPANKKEEIVALFNAIPTKSGKVKRPFMREMPPELHERRKERIKKAALKERDTAQALLNVQPDDVRNQAKVSKIDAALKAFDEMCETDYVPRTWHGMVDMGDE
jgi:hypothetical protein